MQGALRVGVFTFACVQFDVLFRVVFLVCGASLVLVGVTNSCGGERFHVRRELEPADWETKELTIEVQPLLLPHATVLSSVLCILIGISPSLLFGMKNDDSCAPVYVPLSNSSIACTK